MPKHVDPNQSNKNTNQALNSLVRLLAQQSAQEVLSASLNEGIPNSAGNLSNAPDTSTFKTNSSYSVTDFPEAE